MKQAIIFTLLIGVMSCSQQDNAFKPIETTKDLSEKQIDSILTKFNFKYEKPILIDSTDMVLIPISTDILKRTQRTSKWGHYTNDFPRFWNVLFYDKSTGASNLLTKSKTRISEIYTNRGRQESQDLKSLILYKLTQIDYNNDGRLNHQDPEFLYASNLYGTDLVQISPMNEDLMSFHIMPYSNQILLRTVRDNNQDSLFNNEDETILYKAELSDSKWQLSEIVDSNLRMDIEKLYLDQWLTKSEE